MPDSGVYNKPVVIDGEKKTKLQVSRSRPRVEEGFPPGQSAAVGGRARSQPVIRDAVVFDNSPPQVRHVKEIESPDWLGAGHVKCIVRIIPP